MDVLVFVQAFKFAFEEALPFRGPKFRAGDEDVLVAATAHVNDDRLVLRNLLCDFHGGGSGVGAFEGEEYAFVFRKEAHRVENVLIEDAHEFDASACP